MTLCKVWIKFVTKMRFRRRKKSKLKEKEEDKGIFYLILVFMFDHNVYIIIVGYFPWNK